MTKILLSIGGGGGDGADRGGARDTERSKLCHDFVKSCRKDTPQDCKFPSDRRFGFSLGRVCVCENDKL